MLENDFRNALTINCYVLFMLKCQNHLSKVYFIITSLYFPYIIMVAEFLIDFFNVLCISIYINIYKKKPTIMCI